MATCQDVGKERKRGNECYNECYSRSGITMSMTSLLDSADETVLAAGAAAGVDDLESSWVITGMAIALKGMTMTSRWRLARKSVSQNRRWKGI